MNIAPALRTCTVALTLLAAGNHTAQRAGAELVPESLVRQQGLTRAWFSQVQLDRSRHVVERAILGGEQLFVLTTNGTLHAFDAETGATNWVTRIGEPRYVSLGPGVGPDHVAVVNGTTVFVLDRADGREVKTFRTNGGVAAAPAIADGYVYVPLFNGRLEGFPIDAKRLTPWYYSSSGRLFQPPVAGAGGVVWANNRGNLYGASAADTGTRYRFEAGDSFVAAPTTLNDRVYAATADGYVYAIEKAKGRQRWRYSSGSTVYETPVVIGDTLYVTTGEPALHAVDLKKGEAKWITGGVAEFVAASEKRLYCLDRLGSFLVLDRETGSPISRVASRGSNTPVLNEQSDRLYVYSSDGLVQCFHEIGSDKPYRHRPIEAPKADEPEPTKAKPPAREEPAKKEPDPFAGGSDPFGGGGDPFGGGGGDGAGGGDNAGEDPFGGGGEDPFGGGAGDGDSDGADEDPFAEGNPFDDLEGGSDNPFGAGF
ncbi:MAG: PQQ-binding-like beta-propeller repeat protein [Planctomycetota bacterium]